MKGNDILLKRFKSYYKSHKKLFILDFSSAFISSGLELMFPYFVNILIDDIIPNGKIEKFCVVIFILFIGYVLIMILTYIIDYYGHVMGVRMEYDMRNDLFTHIQKLSFTYFDNTKKGHIMSKMINDLNDISEFAHHGPEDFFVAMVTILGSFGIMFTMNVKLAVATFSFIPIMIIFIINKNKKMKSVFREMRLKIADVNAQIEDSIGGIRAVKAFSNEDYEKEKFEKGNASFKYSRESAFRIMGTFYSGIEFISNMLYLFIIAFGSFLVFNNQAQVGEIIAFILYVNIFIKPIRKITILIENFQKAMTGFERFCETIDIQPDIIDSTDSKDVNNIKGNIEFRNIKFSYDENNIIIKNLSLKINSGEKIALIGPSGAGKTTLLSLIPRFYEVDEGDIFIDEINIKDIKLKSLRSHIGIVQQEVVMFSGTIRENIAYGKLDATDEEIVEAAKKANAHEFIINMEKGYYSYIGEKGIKLSGGQKQRISIARIFLKNPSILILDEATSALDNESERLIQKSLDELSVNRTTLVIAHRLSTIISSDKIFVMDKNGIVESGTHKFLLNENGLYAKLYNLQFNDEDYFANPS
ncbi:MAG: ABC transporter ATP-binding protein [Filifactoraceae bacterium]